MLVPDRRRRVLEHVRRSGSARVEDLAAELGVSPWTVRRDLLALEQQGQLRRARGGAVAVRATDDPSLSAGPVDPATDAEKARIGRHAAEQLTDDSTVMLLAGSTTGALVPRLRHRRLTVVTNGLEIATGLMHAPDISLVVVGGYLHREQMTLLGPLTEATMADLHVDLIVAGAYGVHPDIGVTGAKVIQAGYHHGMLRHTDGLMVVADAGKLGRRGPTVLAALPVVDSLVTDDAADDAVVEAIRQRGPEVVVV